MPTKPTHRDEDGGDIRMPAVSQELVDALKARFPSPIPELSHTDREVWFNRGAWSVIQFLEDAKDAPHVL